MSYEDTMHKLTQIANAEYRTDDIEIDPLNGGDDISVVPDEGVWVRAWVYLSSDLIAEHDPLVAGRL